MTAPAGGYTVAEAAARLGVTPDAIRRRLHRGTLAGDKTDDGQWRVWLPDLDPERDPEQPPGPVTGERHDAARTPPDARQDAARTAPAPDLVASYEARLMEMGADVAFLRAELEARTEEIRRRDHIIAGLVERIRETQQIGPGDILDAEERSPSMQKSANASVERSEAPGRVDPHEMTSRALREADIEPEPAQVQLVTGWRRWWRRITGA